MLPRPAFLHTAAGVQWASGKVNPYFASYFELYSLRRNGVAIAEESGTDRFVGRMMSDTPRAPQDSMLYPHYVHG